MKEEYIPRSAVLSKTHDIHVKSKAGDVDYSHRCIDPSDVEAIPAADVRPVTTCDACVWHVDNGYHYCNKWCAPCPDNAEFFCAYGERPNCGADMREES